MHPSDIRALMQDCELPGHVVLFRVERPDGAAPRTRPGWGWMPVPDDDLDHLAPGERGSVSRKVQDRLWRGDGWRCAALAHYVGDWWPAQWLDMAVEAGDKLRILAATPENAVLLNRQAIFVRAAALVLWEYDTA